MPSRSGRTVGRAARGDRAGRHLSRHLTPDWRALAYAIPIEAGLLVLAAFGGPHGELGAIPWILQLPGILIVLYPPNGAYFAVRVAAAALLQVGLWYLALSAIRRRKFRVARGGA